MRSPYLKRSEITKLVEEHNCDPDGTHSTIRGDQNILAFLSDVLDKYEENRAKAQPSDFIKDNLEAVVEMARDALSRIGSFEYCDCGCPSKASARILPAYHSWRLAHEALKDIDYLLYNRARPTVMPEGLEAEDPTTVLKVARLFAHRIDETPSDEVYLIAATQVLALMKALKLRAQLEHTTPHKVEPATRHQVDFRNLRPGSTVTFVMPGQGTFRRRGSFSHVLLSPSGAIETVVVVTTELGTEVHNYIDMENVVALESKLPMSSR